MENKTLGQSLKDARQRSKLTLRQVEESAAVSNAYLSQLENDKIKKPSADVLYRLSRLYDEPIEKFLCGIIKQTEKVLPHRKGISLTEEEEQKLIEYLNFLRHKR